MGIVTLGNSHVEKHKRQIETLISHIKWRVISGAKTHETTPERVHKLRAAKIKPWVLFSVRRQQTSGRSPKLTSNLPCVKRLTIFFSSEIQISTPGPRSSFGRADCDGDDLISF